MPPVALMGISVMEQKGHKCSSACPGCSTNPHPVVAGEARQGSPNVKCNGVSVVCATHQGFHRPCCNPMPVCIAVQGSSTVKVNGLGIHTEEMMTSHCGIPGGKTAKGTGYATVIASI